MVTNKGYKMKERIHTLLSHHLGRMTPLWMPPTQTILINDDQNNYSKYKTKFMSEECKLCKAINNTKKNVNPC
jgi:hypothetical protein